MAEGRELGPEDFERRRRRHARKLGGALERAHVAAALGDFRAALGFAKAALAMVGSQERAGVLTRLPWEVFPAESLRSMLLEWPGCDGAREESEDIREMFLRAAPVTDDRSGMPGMPCTVFRGHFAEDDPLQGLSWTLSSTTAEWFAKYLTSSRAEFVCINGSGLGVVTEAICGRALGYFISRNEQELIPAPNSLTIVRQWPVEGDSPIAGGDKGET